MIKQLAGVLALCGFLGHGIFTPSPAVAQDNKTPWSVLIAYEKDAKPILIADDKDEKPRAKGRVALRPNVAQPVFVFLQYGGPVARKNVEVKLVRLRKGKAQVLGQAVMEKVGKEPLEVQFQPLAPAKGAAPPKGEPPASTDDGPPFQFQVLVKEEKKDVVTLPLPVMIQQPHEYMAAPRLATDDKGLTVVVGVKKIAADVPCKVELVLDPDVKKGGRFKEKLTANSEAQLFLNNMKFPDNVPPRNGRLYLTVDDYERAYGYNLANLRELKPVPSPRVRVRAPRYFNPASDPKANKLSATIEVDGVMDKDAQLKVTISRGAGGNSVLPLLPGLRRQTLAAVADGHVEFTTSVKDWKVEPDIAGIVGKVSVAVEVLDADKNPIKLADEEDPEDEAPSLFFSDFARNKSAVLKYEGNKVSADIVVDDSEPENVEFVDLPKKASPGATLQLKARATKRRADQAPISKVEFFANDPKKEKPIPALLKDDHWQADWTIPPSAKESVALEVRFTTAAGLSGLKPADEIALLAKNGGGDDSKEKSKITGKVKSLFDSEKGVPDVEVLLLEGKAKTKATTRTDKKGIYTFKDVEPGDYVVSAFLKGVSKGEANASVPKGKAVTVKADIQMKRLE